MSELVEQLVQVEHVLDLGDEVHVLFSVPVDANFALTDDSTLDGRPVRKWLSQPRVLGKNGKPRLDMLKIILKSISDASYFQAGERSKLLVEPISR
ncbi:hypothetical protein GCM10007100_40620 [Roseibacillus persicicus]|uniref:Uncharacterized protein n=1 Tax=Roseibacillus persicicus TaxID=454148 RepID=A0A918TYL9_9BACT|nr:hypothetical protein GCM10007100_40620 [Roseibacillus persicicus]